MDNFLKEYSCLLKMCEILWLDTARTMATRSCSSINLSSATSLDSGWQKLVDFCLLQEITSVVTPTSFTIFFDIKGHFLSCISYQKKAFFFSSSSKTIKALKLCFHQDITQPMIKFLANSKVFGKHHSPVRSTSATLLTPSFFTNFTNSAQTGDVHRTGCVKKRTF